MRQTIPKDIHNDAIGYEVRSPWQHEPGVLYKEPHRINWGLILALALCAGCWWAVLS